MDERSASPEIDVVGYSDRSGLFRSQSESFSTWTSGRNATALHAANQNGANRLAVNTNTKANKAETVNLRVRNMGKITVKKEPESDEDCEVSYSLSSLLQECDFEQAPRAKTRALKSPTSLAIAKSKSMEAARSVTGRSRQTLENVISSLKSARSTDTNQPKFAKKPSGFQNPVVPISMPSQIVSVAPTAQSTVSFPGSGVVSSGPQIVEVRSLATGAQTCLSGAAVGSTRSTTSKPVPLRPLPITAAPNTRMTALNTGHTATATSNLPVTTVQATVSQLPASTIRISSVSGPKPLNIRFVLPATEPFNTSGFQQVLQTALATVISQSKGVDASLFQQAIQAALTTLTKATGPVTANQLQQCIQSSLAALSGTRLIPQVTPASLTQAPGVRVLQPLLKQPQPIAPVPPRVPLQSTSRTGNQIFPATSVVSSVSTGPQIVTNASGLVVSGGNQLPSGVVTSLAAPLNLNQSPLNSARDALIKALQEKRVLNSPPSLSSSSLSSTSEAPPSVAAPDSIDEPFSGSPPSSPVLPTLEKPAEDSAVPDKSQAPTSAISDTTCTAKTVEQTTTVTSTARTPLIVLRSGTFLKPNQSPVNSGTQTASIKMPVQVQAPQGNSLPATPGTPTFTPQTTTVNLIGQTSAKKPVQVQASQVNSLPATPVTQTFTQQTTTVNLIGQTSAKKPVQVQASQVNSLPATPVTQTFTPQTTTVNLIGQTSAKKPVQVQASQVNSLPATPVTQTFTPQTTTVNLISQISATVQSIAPSLPASTIRPVMVPTQLVQFSVAPAISSNVPVTKPESKPAATKTKSTQCTSGGFCAGGCCIYCRTCHENNNICGLPTCQKAFPNRAALRKHYHFNPSHKYVVPMEKASMACDNFLPLEIGDSHRRARLRELFKRLPDDEFLDLVKPRVVKMISLFELLEQKSLRVQSGGISAFKMFTEFERFRRDVESKLLELILLPQGKDQAKGSKRSRKDGSKPTDADNSSQGDQTTPRADKQGNKDSLSSDAANTADQKLESSSAQPKTDANPNAGSSETAKKTVETICLDLDAEKSTRRTSDTGAGLANHDNPSIGAINNDTMTVEDKKASDSPLSEERSEESGKESGDVTSTSLVSSKVSPVESFPSKDGVDKEDEKREGEPSEGSSSLPQSVEVNSESAKSFDGKSGADQPSEQPKQTENMGHISDESTPKDTTSVTMEIDDSSKALRLQSSDVVMVDDQSETKSCSNDEEPKSGKEEQAGKGEKPIHVIDLVSKEDNPAIDASAEKNSEAAGRSASGSADATQEDKITEIPDGGNEISMMDVEEEGEKTGSDKVQAKESAVEKRDEVGNKVDCAKLTCDEKETVRDDDQTEKSKMDPDNQAKEGQQQETTKNKADGSCEGKKVETINIDNDSDMTTVSTSKETLGVSMVTDKPDSNINKDASKEKTSLEKDSDQVKEVPKSSNKGEETNPESTKEKIAQECCTDADSKVKESGKASSSEIASSSGNTLDSSDATAAGTSNSGPQTGSDAAKKKRKFITLEDLDLGDDDDEDGADETNMLDFSLPFAVKWGRIVQRVRSVEAKKIARKENYSEQDMKQFIYNKPKDAANAVIIADCHAHPSFFRAYVMPALLDKHIDDFGLFGKKLLSRLVLPKQKYVQILRTGIGPELAKILGINIFPTFKRIQDTWISVRNPLGTTSRSSASKPVITIEEADDVDIPDDDNDAATADKAVRPTNNSQNTADTAKDSLKRPGPSDSVENDNNKRLRVDNTDSQKDASQTKECNKGQTENSEKDSQKDGSQPNEANKGQKSAESGGAIKDAQDNKIQAEERNKNQTGKLNPAQTSAKTAAPVINLETEKGKSRATSSVIVSEKETTPQPVVDDADAPDTDSVVLMSVDDNPKSSDVTPKEGTTSSVGVEKSPCSTTSAKTIPTSSCSTSKPSTSVEATSAKTCASSIIPAKATIYTTGVGKKGAASVPLPTTKGSPLFLVPVERISPKLVEQYIQQGKGDGMKTRSSDKKKPKKPKQGSQVLVLIPSSNPNGSPTIQTLTSAEQLESTGDKKPLLLLPADKVPKSIASQSQTVRRKMVITMVAPSSGAVVGTKSKPSSTQNVSATSTSSGAAGQSSEPTSAVQSVKGPIMSTQEGKANTASTKDKSDRGKPATESGCSASVDSTAKSIASVVNNTSAVNVSSKDSSASSKQSGSGTGLTDGDNADSQGAAGSKGSNSQSDEVPSSDTAGDSLKESSTGKESTSNKETIEDGGSTPAASEASTSAVASSGDVDGNQSTSSNTELDMLGSSVLPSDITLDSLLKDIEEDGSGGKANEIPPLDVSEIIRSFEDLPVESDSGTAGDSSLFDTGGDTSTVGDSSEGGNDIQMASSIQDRSSLQDEHSYANSRRQSPRRTPASSKPASGRSTPDVSDSEYGLRKTSSPSKSGGAKEDSDVDEGSPPRKRRKAPTRTSARSSPQVTFVPDKVAPGKSPQSSSAKAKGRKQ